MDGTTNWPALLEAYEGSGLSQAQFCMQHGVAVWTFKKHLHRSRKEAASMGGFSQLSVSAGLAPTAGELHFTDGTFVRFAGGIEASYLCALILGLRR